MSTKTRAPNWTSEEVRVLVSSYIEKKDIIESKFSPELTIADKHRAYNEIADAVNTVSQSGRRSVDQVKKQIIDFKSKTKKKASAIRADRERTGGGPSTELRLSPIEELLVSTMNPQTIEGIIPDGDSEVLPIGEKITEKYESNDLESPHSVEIINEISTPERKYGTKKRKFSYASTSSENRVTANHAEMILEIEKSKLEIANNLFIIKKLKLKAYLKELDSKGVDILEELEELKNLD